MSSDQSHPLKRNIPHHPTNHNYPTNPKVYAEHYATRAAACRRHHIGSLQESPHTLCDPVVPLLVAFYDPR
jgi:hypothetical protein